MSSILQCFKTTHAWRKARPGQGRRGGYVDAMDTNVRSAERPAPCTMLSCYSLLFRIPSLFPPPPDYFPPIFLIPLMSLSTLHLTLLIWLVPHHRPLQWPLAPEPVLVARSFQVGNRSSLYQSLTVWLHTTHPNEVPKVSVRPITVKSLIYSSQSSVFLMQLINWNMKSHLLCICFIHHKSIPCN